jgi:SMC interacting uncharacterized protein involved in chromosome segregation
MPNMRETAVVLPVSPLAPPTLLPGEDLSHYEALAEAVRAAFRARTAYVKILVDNLVMIEWEIQRIRRQRDELYQAAYARAGQEPDFLMLGMGSRKLPQDQAEIDERERRARALTMTMPERDLLERKLGALEDRRRSLIRDIKQFNREANEPVEDAEISGPE